MNNEIDIKLIVRHFEGTCTPAENQMVEDWLAADPARKDELDALRMIWSTPAKKRPAVDLENAWSAVRIRTGIGEASTVPSGRHDLSTHMKLRSPVAYVMRIAAVLVVMLGISYLAVQYLTPPQEAKQMVMREIATDKGQRVRVRFGDGTSVILNSASIIRFPEKFSGDVREVHLQGEAFFDVARAEDLPFVVHTTDAVVRVLGTGFNVRAWPDENQVEVVVARGKVSVRSEWVATKQEVVLTQGQGSNVPRGDVPTEPRVVDLDTYLSWTEGRMEFQRTPLEDVVKQLQRRYNVRFEIKDTMLLRKTLTASVKNESLTEVLNLISLSLDIEYRKTQDTVTFSRTTR